MQTQSFKIVMNNPCSENWNDMTMLGDNRYCSKCQKTILDFSQFRDDEIIDFISKNNITQGCGRFRKEQIDRIVIPIEYEHFNQRSSSFQKFLILLFICFGHQLISFQFVSAQTITQDSIPQIQITDSSKTEEKIDSTIVVEINDSIKAITDSQPKLVVNEVKISDSILTIKLPIEVITSGGFYAEPIVKPITIDMLNDTNKYRFVKIDTEVAEIHQSKSEPKYEIIAPNKSSQPKKPKPPIQNIMLISDMILPKKTSIRKKKSKL